MIVFVVLVVFRVLRVLFFFCVVVLVGRVSYWYVFFLFFFVVVVDLVGRVSFVFCLFLFLFPTLSPDELIKVSPITNHLFVSSFSCLLRQSIYEEFGNLRKICSCESFGNLRKL